MAGIENYWKELKTDLEQKRKDITDLNRMHNLYKSDEFLSVINDIEKKIKENEEKLCFIQKVIWDVRSRIIFCLQTVIFSLHFSIISITNT